MTRNRAFILVAAACALPRLALLGHERGAILDAVEKSRLLAATFVQSGTFGYIPGHPSAYTQPLYGWFLIPIIWITGLTWWSLGGLQILVAVCTSLVVLETGRRFLSLRIGILAALLATLHPYVVWHDIHGNREILDQLLGAAMFAVSLWIAKHPTLRSGAALGLLCGVAILSNARLTALPLALAGFLLWRKVDWRIAVAVPLLAVVALAPWVIRNKVEVGCFAITTDARALWKANNANTYATLAQGLWLDQVTDVPQRTYPNQDPRWLNPQEAGDQWHASFGPMGVIDSTSMLIRRQQVVHVDECWQQSQYEHLVFQFWEHHPGAKVKLMVQATEMLWNPQVESDAGPTNVGGARTWVEPAFMIPLYLLALAGLFVVPPALRALALLFAGYETVGAWAFAGTTRYRIPWDFVLALLAAAVLVRLWERVRPTAAPPAPAG